MYVTNSLDAEKNYKYTKVLDKYHIDIKVSKLDTSEGLVRVLEIMKEGYIPEEK